LRGRNHEYEGLSFVVAVLLLEDGTYRHKRRGVEDAVKLQRSGMVCRGPDDKMRGACDVQV